MKSKVRGRPKKPSTETRNGVLRIRLTQTERETLNKAAESRALDSSAWARMVLLDAAKEMQQN